ncbi:MAG: hypothetical protein ACRD2J_17790, partial [Thermoanaerobaculia bacterium]
VALAVRAGEVAAVASDPAALPARVAAGAGVVVSRAALMHAATAVASDGDLFLAAWIERTATADAIRATRITAAGAPLDGEGIVVRTTTDDLLPPVVAAGGGAFAVVWQEGAKIYARRVAVSGAIVDPQPLLLGTGTEPRAIWDGRAFFVVWNGSGTTPAGIFGATLGGTPTTARLTTASPGPTHAEHHENPAVAWNGTGYLLAFGLRRVDLCGGASCPESETLALLRLDAGRNPSGAIVEVAGAAAAAPRVAPLGSGEFIVAWSAGGIHAAGVRADPGGITVTGQHVVFNTGATLIELLSTGTEARVFWNRSGIVGIPGVSLAGLATVAVVGGGEPRMPREGVGTAWEGAARGAGRILLVRAAPRAEEPYLGVSRAVGSFLEGAAVLPAPPATPSGVTATRRGDAVEVRWNPSPGTALYRVEIDPGYGFVASVHTVEPFVRVAAVAGTRFRVIALNEGGSSAASEVTPISVPPRRRLVSRGGS